jgi:hypothetical protein
LPCGKGARAGAMGGSPFFLRREESKKQHFNLVFRGF